MLCELCNRDVQSIGKHHLNPRKFLSRRRRAYAVQRGERMTVSLCADCEHMIHATFRLSQLHTEMDTLENLKSNEKIKKYVEWVSSRPEGVVTHARRSWLGGKYE
jgi:hypothetical protein